MNQIFTPAGLGMLGVYCADVGKIQKIIERLPRARRAGVVRIAGDSDSFRATLISGPQYGSSHRLEQHGPEGNVLVVCFDGHLVEPVAGIDVPLHEPAEIARLVYCRSGIRGVGRLNGNFSVVIFDPTIAKMYIVRDSAGTRPFFYCFSDHLVFGTSAIEVLRASGLAAVADPRGISRYLTDGSVAGTSHTLLENVSALTRGQYLSATPDFPPVLHEMDQGEDHPEFNGSVASFNDAADGLRALLLKTIDAQARGARVGVALSGGVDSSGIVANLRKAVGPREPINVFTFVHEHPALPKAWDERPWAELAASHADATLHPVRLEAATIPGMMARIFENQDFPFSSPVIFAQAQLCCVAAEAGMQVMLSGHGPDVIFGGGNSHIIARASQLLRDARVLEAWRFVQGASSYAGARPQRLMLSAAYQLAPLLLRGMRQVAYPEWARKSWFQDRITSAHEYPVFESKDRVQRLILEQLSHSVVPTSLLLESCNTGAHGLDNRLPYLVPAMVRMARALPPEYLVSKTGETKCILRQALRGMVPGAILDRRDRVGFAVPALQWLNELAPWVHDRLHELHSLPFYKVTHGSHILGHPNRVDLNTGKNAFLIWRWITLLAWVKANNITF